MPLKILSLPVDLSACGYYRIRKPLEGIKKYTEHDTAVIDLSRENIADLAKVFPEIDIIYMRPGSEFGWLKIKEIPALQGRIKAKVVLDIDDNTDLVSPYSQFYASYGTAEFTDPDTGIKIWEDGKAGFSIQANLTRLSYLKWGLKNADLVTVTTKKLAEHALEYNQNVYVNDNTIDFNHWWRLDNKINKPLRIVWQGSPSHYADWYSIKQPLNKLMKEFDLELIMMGSQYEGVFDEENKKKVRALPWVAFDAHSYRMMSIQADIGIIPLADEPFNHYKSAIKMYENNAMGLPSLVANVTPYKEEIVEGVNALSYSNDQEFYDKLKKLITNKGLRANLSNSSYQWVRKHKSLEEESKKLAKRLEELCK